MKTTLLPKDKIKLQFAVTTGSTPASNSRNGGDYTDINYYPTLAEARTEAAKLSGSTEPSQRMFCGTAYVVEYWSGGDVVTVLGDLDWKSRKRVEKKHGSAPVSERLKELVSMFGPEFCK